MIEQYRKLVAAIIGNTVTLLIPHVPGIEKIASPEVVQLLSFIITNWAVWYFPNTVGGVNTLEREKESRKGIM